MALGTGNAGSSRRCCKELFGFSNQVPKVSAIKGVAEVDTLNLSYKRKPPHACFPLCWLYNYFT